MKTKKRHPIDKFCGMLAPGTAAPTHVRVPVALWAKIDALVKRGREVREHPESWPLTPAELANEVRALHYQLSQIDQSADFLRVTLTDAVGKYVEHVRETPT